MSNNKSCFAYLCRYFLNGHLHYVHTHKKKVLKVGIVLKPLSCGFPQNVSCSFLPNRSSWIFTDLRLVTLKGLCVESHEVVILGRVHFLDK